MTHTQTATRSIKIQNGKTNKQDDLKLSRAYKAIIGGGTDFKNKVTSFCANKVSAMNRMRVLVRPHEIHLFLLQ